jgi:hypothetical protein
MVTSEAIDWTAEQERFMTLAYTRCERAALTAFKKWHERKKDDAVQEALSKLWYQWRCCLEKGKDPAGMIGPLIHWAIMFVRYDRRIAGRAPCYDVYDYRAGMVRHLMDGRGKLEPHERSDRVNGFIDWSPEAGSDDPAELASALEQAGMTMDEYVAA